MGKSALILSSVKKSSFSFAFVKAISLLWAACLQRQPPVLPGPHFLSADTRAQASSLLMQQGNSRPQDSAGPSHYRRCFFSTPCPVLATTCCTRPKFQEVEVCFPQGCKEDPFPSGGTHGCPVHSSWLTPWETTTSVPSALEGSRHLFCCISSAWLWPCLSGGVPLQNASPCSCKGLHALGPAWQLQPWHSAQFWELPLQDLISCLRTGEALYPNQFLCPMQPSERKGWGHHSTCWLQRNHKMQPVIGVIRSLTHRNDQTAPSSRRDPQALGSHVAFPVTELTQGDLTPPRGKMSWASLSCTVVPLAFYFHAWSFISGKGMTLPSHLLVSWHRCKCCIKIHPQAYRYRKQK